jgi:hypothetical protein
MTMITQTVDPHHFISRARQIKAQIPSLLSQWGLLPKFKRWRLAQDPSTGMVVLFGVLNTKYIAMHTTTPFSNYFDPRLLRDLATALHVQVISSANDGLRYAFILERGQIGLPSPVPVEMLEYSPVEQASPNGIQLGLIEIRTKPAQSKSSILVDDLTIQRQELAFLKVVEALDALNNATTKPAPDVSLMDEAEFNQQMAECEVNRNNNNPQMFSGSAG